MMVTQFLVCRVVKSLQSILQLPNSELVVGNLARFEEDYGPGEVKATSQRRKAGPADYKATFTGDTSDNFKLGIILRRKSMKVMHFENLSAFKPSPGARVRVMLVWQFNNCFGELQPSGLGRPEP